MKHFLAYSYDTNRTITQSTYIYKGNNVYFTSTGIAKEAVKHIGEERLKRDYWGVY